ncbi:hypothetical protein G6F55_013981 [Rhizopus delemar]|nr:hypothetical protein G6F55_013981 [Rhizopus delemar]
MITLQPVTLWYGAHHVRKDVDLSVARGEVLVRGAVAGGRQGHHRHAALGPQHRHGVPALRTVPAPVGDREPVPGPGQGAAPEQGRGPRAGAVAA